MQGSNLSSVRKISLFLSRFNSLTAHNNVTDVFLVFLRGGFKASCLTAMMRCWTILVIQQLNEAVRNQVSCDENQRCQVSFLKIQLRFVGWHHPFTKHNPINAKIWTESRADWFIPVWVKQLHLEACLTSSINGLWICVWA